MRYIELKPPPVQVMNRVNAVVLEIMNEKDFETALRIFIKISGGWATKIHADAMQGRDTLDLFGSFDGRPFYVDVKRRGGEASAMQEYLVKRAKRTGYVAGIVETIDEFTDLFPVRTLTGDIPPKADRF